MKRYLVLCNTYSQFIIAIHMKLTMLKSHKVTIALTDQSNEMNKVKNRLEHSSCIFEDVFYFKTKEYCSHKSAFGFIKDIAMSVLGDNKFSELDKNVYDEIIYYNVDYALLSIYDKLLKKNSNIICSRYEEGVLSYNHEFTYRRLEIICGIRKIFHCADPREKTNLFYCFYPDLYKGNLETVKIPMIEDDSEELKNLMKICFDIRFDDGSYKEKYIFFTSVYDYEGGKPIGEYEAVSKISSVVGKDNILIKQHPRDSRDIYRENGFRVDENSAIPWEAIQFQIDLKNKVLLTVNSSSVLSSVLLFKNGAKSFFAFKLCDLQGNSMAKESIISIKELLDNKVLLTELSSISVLNNEEELLEIYESTN